VVDEQYKSECVGGSRWVVDNRCEGECVGGGRWVVGRAVSARNIVPTAPGNRRGWQGSIADAGNFFLAVWGPWPLCGA